MCGIAGIAHWTGTSFEKTVQKMCQTMIHRGPDGGHVQELRGACLGHRRLAIIDLSQGANQPMADNSGRYFITFNGEIYGYQSLKDELISLGCQFRTASDTEVILEGFKKWGIAKLCKKLTGMFAFAIWDNLEQVLYLVRDRFGEKPLYFYQYEGTFRFASYAKALFTDIATPRLNPTAIVAFLHHGFCLPDYPIYEGLQALRPASYMIVTKDNNIKESTYWEPSFEPKINQSTEQWLDAIDNQLTQIVNDELISDVGIGTLLSGGVDSSLISTIAASIKPDVNLFTIKMLDNPSLDESEIAKIVAKKIGGKHHIIEAKPIPREDFITLQQQFSEPLGDSSAIGMWLVSKVARENVTVVLTGDGGDELFAGYNTIKQHIDWQKARSYANNFLGKSIHTLSKNILFRVSDRPFFRKITTFTNLISNSAKEVHLKQTLMPQKLHIGLFGPLTVDAAKELYHLDILSKLWNKGIATDELDKLMSFDLYHTLLGDFIPKVDTATMFHSLEARTPFLHHHIADLAFKMPIDVKRLNNQSKGITKALLTKKIGEENSAHVIQGKRGFVIPIDYWLDNEWKDLVERLPTSKLVQEGYLSKQGVLKVINGYKKYPSTYSRIRYSLVALDIWYRNNS